MPQKLNSPSLHRKLLLDNKEWSTFKPRDMHGLHAALTLQFFAKKKLWIPTAGRRYLFTRQINLKGECFEKGVHGNFSI